MKRLALLPAIFVGLFLAACGGSGGGETTTYTFPSESMEPAISYQEQVTVKLDAYTHAAPAVGDIVAFHPSPNAKYGECGVHRPSPQPCPQATPGVVSSQVFMKRIVAGPGDKIAILHGLPIVNGKAVLTHVIRKCPATEPSHWCKMPKPITIPPGHYFVMGDNSIASEDSRFWGPISQAAIFGKVELG